MINFFEGLPGNFAMPPSNVSPNLKNLVSNAIASSFNEEHKTLPQSPSQGSIFFYLKNIIALKHFVHFIFKIFVFF